MSEKNERHTPTPWIVCGNEANWRSDVTSKIGTVCSCEGGIEDAEANAAFIVRAVNAYEEHNLYIDYVRLMVEAKGLVLTLSEWRESRRILDAIVKSESSPGGRG